MAAAPGAKSVLIVEDDDSIRDLIRDAVRGAGFAAQAVPRAEQAIPVLESGRFDIVVLDLGMPRGAMQGMELLARLREADQWNALPVVILSGYGDVLNRDVATRLGVAAILSKPLADITELLDVLRRIAD